MKIIQLYNKLKNEGLILDEVLTGFNGQSSLLDDIITSLQVLKNPTSKYKNSIYDLGYKKEEDAIKDLQLCLTSEMIDELNDLYL